MRRNIERAIEQDKAIGRKNDRLDITLGELEYFYKEFCKEAESTSIGNAIFEIVGKAYNAGLAVGSRNN